MGFSYAGDGLRNDLDALFAHLTRGQNAALCNIRVGHIVTLVAAREENGERQALALDPYSESADARVLEQVREGVPGSEIVSAVRNGRGLRTGTLVSFAAFWVALSTVRDFNLLHALVEGMQGTRRLVR